MDVVDLRPDLRMLVASPGQAYLLRGADGVTLVDTGPVGSAGAISEALTSWGAGRSHLRRVIVTHWHHDHTGSLAEIGGWPDVEVLAHRLDAPVIRGEAAGAVPELTAAERALHAKVALDLPPAPPARVDVELDDGDVIPGLGARIFWVPGHTEGSIAVLVPGRGVLFTGDVAAFARGQVILGPFNADRARAAQSFRRFGDVQADAVCFGHGEPLLGEDAQALALAGRQPVIPDPLA